MIYISIDTNAIKLISLGTHMSIGISSNISKFVQVIAHRREYYFVLCFFLEIVMFNFSNFYCIGLVTL